MFVGSEMHNVHVQSEFKKSELYNIQFQSEIL